MRQETMNVLLAIKKSSLMKHGEVPIIIRITIDGVRDEARIQRSIIPSLWNQAKGCCKGKDRNSLKINNFIDALKTKAHHLHKELLLEEVQATVQNPICNIFEHLLGDCLFDLRIFTYLSCCTILE